MAIKGRTQSLGWDSRGLNGGGHTNLHEIKGLRRNTHTSKVSCPVWSWKGGPWPWCYSHRRCWKLGDVATAISNEDVWVPPPEVNRLERHHPLKAAEGIPSNHPWGTTQPTPGWLCAVQRVLCKNKRQSEPLPLSVPASPPPPQPSPSSFPASPSLAIPVSPSQPPLPTPASPCSPPSTCHLATAGNHMETALGCHPST